MKLPNFGYHLARWKGRALRRIYQMFLPLIVRDSIKSPRALALDVFAYSNEYMLPEQIRSVRSFLRYVGRPKSFTVISDGSHTAPSILPRRMELCLAVSSSQGLFSCCPFRALCTLGVCKFPISLTEVCMHHVVSIKRCSLAVALAMALLLSPAVGFAQLGGLPIPIPTPTTTTASSVVGSASAVSSTVLGVRAIP